MAWVFHRTEEVFREIPNSSTRGRTPWHLCSCPGSHPRGSGCPLMKHCVSCQCSGSSIAFENVLQVTFQPPDLSLANITSFNCTAHGVWKICAAKARPGLFFLCVRHLVDHLKNANLAWNGHVLLSMHAERSKREWWFKFHAHCVCYVNMFTEASKWQNKNPPKGKEQYVQISEWWNSVRFSMMKYFQILLVFKHM